VPEQGTQLDWYCAVFLDCSQEYRRWKTRIKLDDFRGVAGDFGKKPAISGETRNRSHMSVMFTNFVPACSSPGTSGENPHWGAESCRFASSLVRSGRITILDRWLSWWRLRMTEQMKFGSDIAARRQP
jgi:hypothetical protein